MGPPQELACICESVYRDALTRGQVYDVIAADEEGRQVKVAGDDGRVRWFPAYCFDRAGVDVPVMVDFAFDDPLFSDVRDPVVEVSVRLSTGERRWCIFATPQGLMNNGNWIDGTQISFHWQNRHLIVAAELSEDLIGRMLRYIDSQGDLVECTRALPEDTE